VRFWYIDELGILLNCMKCILNKGLSILILSTATSFASPSLAQEVTCSDTIHARAVTKGYYVNICGSRSTPTRYVGSSKNGQSIVLPLKSYGNGIYTAKSGTIQYTLTSSYLKVTKNGKILIKEKIISQNSNNIISQASEVRTVIVYGRDGCSRTQHAIQQLAQQGVKYQYKNTDNQADANEMYQRIRNANITIGNSVNLPVIYVNTPKTTVINPNITEIINLYRTN
jgi:glutaredoxin